MTVAAAARCTSNDHVSSLLSGCFLDHFSDAKQLPAGFAQLDSEQSDLEMHLCAPHTICLFCSDVKHAKSHCIRFRTTAACVCTTIPMDINHRSDNGRFLKKQNYDPKGSRQDNTAGCIEFERKMHMQKYAFPGQCIAPYALKMYELEWAVQLGANALNMLSLLALHFFALR